ncbi:MAG: polysaccharide biosynthesis tyrosine autokinase [Desulfocapsaceae bacterium]|nr:polysaccharide biosynthesis tyrosine autokinase [Desulfocapsaceae bacterium]
MQERIAEGDVLERGMSLRECFFVIRKRKNTVFTIAGLVFFAVAVLTFSTTPLYTATSEVVIEQNRGSAGLENQYANSDPEFLETQSEIITSLKVASRVVDNLKLATTYRHYFLPDKKVSSSPAPVPDKAAADGAREKTGNLENAAGKTDSPGDILKSGVNPLSDEAEIALMIQKRLTVKLVRRTKIVDISYTDKHPAMAKMVADGVVTAYRDEILDMKLTTSKYALQWMTAKADDERKKLENSENALQQYMRANDLVTVENKLAIYPQKLTEFSSQLSKAQADKKALEDVFNQIKAAEGNSRQLENVPVFADNAVLKNLRESIFKARQNIKELSKKFGDKHPAMVKANDELSELVNQQQSEINRVIATTKNSYELAKSQENNLQDLLTSTKNELLNLNEKFIQYSIMKRDVDSNRAVYEALTASIKKEGVTEQSQTVNIWAVQEPLYPDAPSKPNKQRNLLLGLILGLMGGLGGALLVEYLDNTIKSEKDLETRFRATVLGTVEQLKESGNTIESYILQQPLSPIAESYRLIRSGLLLSSAEHPPRTVLVTSMEAKEGKTTTTVNIARILCQGNKRVLIIDCDLRRPRIQSLFSLDNNQGLSNFLTGNTDENLIRKIPGEDIFVITSGPVPPNPAELVSSHKMKTLIAKMSENFDFVLLDSPPVQSVTDSLALTRIVDGTIVVVRAGSTTYEMLQSGMKKLSDVRCHVLGFVLNGQSKNNAARSYYSGYTTYYSKDNN